MIPVMISMTADKKNAAITDTPITEAMMDPLAGLGSLMYLTMNTMLNTRNIKPNSRLMQPSLVGRFPR